MDKKKKVEILKLLESCVMESRFGFDTKRELLGYLFEEEELYLYMIESEAKKECKNTATENAQ